MHHRYTLYSLLFTLVTSMIVFILPASAHAVLIGMESNRELVNTTQTPELQAAALDLMKEQGVQVVRANGRWYDIVGGCAEQSAAALIDHTNPCYSWARIDSLVKQANDRGMSVLLSFQQNPSWLFPGTPDTAASDPQYFMGRTNAEFARAVSFITSFYRAAASRYNAGSAHGVVKFWTVHNEPNSAYYWGATPNPARYAQLYGSVAQGIRAASPKALIAPGPTGPTGGKGGIKPVRFITLFQRSVGKYLPGSMAKKRSYINAVAHNPYPDSFNGPSYFLRSQPKDNISMGSIDKLARLLDSHAITRRTKIWATEFGWQTRPEPSQWVTSQQQARYVAEAFDWLDSKRIGKQGRVQIGISYGLTDTDDLVDWQSGTITNAGVKKPSFAMFQRMISVSAADRSGRVKKNTRARIWGRSNVNPSGTLLVWRVVKGKCLPKARVNGFCVVPGQRTVIGTPGAKSATMRMPAGKTLQFAVYDTVSKSYGPLQRVVVRR